MKTEIMSGAGLSAYAEVALLLFFVAFVMVVAFTFAPRFRDRFERDARLPLDDLSSATPRARGKDR